MRSKQAWEQAVRSIGAEPGPRPTPDPAHWIWYAFWGPLPSRYDRWVLYDVTCSTWVLRHIARILTVAVIPVTAMALFLPVPAQYRVASALVAGAYAMLFTAVWINESTEHRLARAGWRPGTGPLLRERRSEYARNS